MSKVVEVKISGGRELYEMLEERPKRIAKAIIRKALKRAAGIWRGEMKDRVAQGWHVWKSSTKGRSREWGFLRGHIGMKLSVRGDELEGSCAVGPVKKGFWAQFLEFGRSDQAAQPFIRPAFESRKEDVLAEFISTAQEELEKEWPAAK
jgi:HK97 gp10 family phage protein